MVNRNYKQKGEGQKGSEENSHRLSRSAQPPATHSQSPRSPPTSQPQSTRAASDLTFGGGAPGTVLISAANTTALPVAAPPRPDEGSPARAPFALAAEFNLLAALDPSSSSSSSSSPAFFLRLKPRLGDFSLSHTLRSPTAAAPAPRKVGEPPGSDVGREVKLVDYRPPFAFTGSGLAADVAAAGTKSGVGALLSGMRLTTRSVLPLWGRATLRFNWGLRVPPELLADDGGDGKGRARAPVSKMPLLVMSKVSIEQSTRTGAGSKAGVRAEAEAEAEAGDAAFSLVRQQLESLNVENVLLRRAVEDLRAEVRSSSRAARPAAAAGRGEGRVAATAVQTQAHPRPQPYHATKPDHRPRGAARESAAAPDDVGEELKKVLEARLR